MPSIPTGPEAADRAEEDLFAGTTPNKLPRVAADAGRAAVEATTLPLAARPKGLLSGVSRRRPSPPHGALGPVEDFIFSIAARNAGWASAGASGVALSWSLMFGSGVLL